MSTIMAKRAKKKKKEKKNKRKIKTNSFAFLFELTTNQQRLMTNDKKITNEK